MPAANPSGRPRTGLAFAEMIREHDRTEERFKVMIAMALGQPLLRAFDANGKPVVETPKPGQKVNAEIVWPSHNDILRANEFINSWGYQKPPTQVEITTKDDESGFDWEKLGEGGGEKIIELLALGVTEGAKHELPEADQPESLEAGDETPALAPAPEETREP